MRKAIIHQFDPVIYPRYLWVVIGSICIDTIKERFSVDKDLARDYEDNEKTKGGFAIKVVQLNTRNQGILVVIPKRSASVRTIAHESVHVADYIFEEIGAYAQDFKYLNEQYDYLVGWAADCIDRVVKNKI